MPSQGKSNGKIEYEEPTLIEINLLEEFTKGDYLGDEPGLPGGAAPGGGPAGPGTGPDGDPGYPGYGVPGG